MEIIAYILFIILGAVMASFLHCVAYREAHGMNWKKGRSKCDACQHNIDWRHNIPIVSYVAQRGKTSCCNKKLSIWHLAIEIVGAVLFGVVAYRYFQSPELVSLARDLIIATFAIFTIVFDSRYGLVSVPASLATLLALATISVATMPIMSIAYGVGIGAGFFAIIRIATRGKGMGIGDIWLGAVMGVTLGFPNIVYSLMIAYIVGAIFAVYLLATHKAKAKDPIPFGAFLMIGFTAVAFFF